MSLPFKEGASILISVFTYQISLSMSLIIFPFTRIFQFRIFKGQDTLSLFFTTKKLSLIFSPKIIFINTLAMLQIILPISNVRFMICIIFHSSLSSFFPLYPLSFILSPIRRKKHTVSVSQSFNNLSLISKTNKKSII